MPLIEVLAAMERIFRQDVRSEQPAYIAAYVQAMDDEVKDAISKTVGTPGSPEFEKDLESERKSQLPPDRMQYGGGGGGFF